MPNLSLSDNRRTREVTSLNQRQRGVLTLTWYTYNVPAFQWDVFFREIWYSDISGFSFKKNGRKIHISSKVSQNLVRINLQYTSSPFLFTDYPLYFFCLQFTAQTVIFDNVARDRYLTKDFNNGLGNEVRPNWRSRNTESSSKLYLTFQQYIMHSCGITVARFCSPSWRFIWNLD